MRNNPTLSVFRALTLAGCALLPFLAFAQTAPAPAGPVPPTAGTTDRTSSNSEVVQLNPFEVKSQQDNSYGALQSNSLTAFSMDLQKMPATAEVFTQQFIQDTHSQTVEQMLINYSGIVGYSPGDAGAYTESSGDRDGSGGLSIRGFGNGGSIKIDGFFGPPSSTRSAAGTTPSFMIEEVDLVEGPQSLLYGAIGAGGVINATYKRAKFSDTSGYVDYSANDLGAKETDIDYNVGAGNLAVRFAATDQDNATVRQNIGNTTKGYYLAGAIKLPFNTIVRLIHNKYETVAENIVDPKISGTTQLPTTNPLSNDSVAYLAVTNQIPAGIFNGAVNWNNIGSFAGWWGNEPSTISNSELEIESSPLKWLAVKFNAIYNQYSDWRDTTAATAIDAPGAGGNPYGVDALQVTNPNLNYQSQRQKAAQIDFLATNNLFNDTAVSQTVLGGYANHVGPSFGSSGISYQYVQADSNWNPVIGTATGNYGRILMPNQFIPLNGTPMRYPLFYPGQSRVTLGGVNYILQPEIIQSAAYKGFPIPGQPTNPYGLIPNGANNLTNTPYGGNFTFSGSFNPGTEEHETFLTFGNYTTWFNGKLSTLAGVSIDKAISYNFGSTAPTFIPWTRYNGFEVGVIYQVTNWMGVYGNLGTAATPAGSTFDLDGNPLATPSARGAPELGLKLHTLDQRYTAQLAWDPQTTDQNEQQGVDGSYLNAVNPNGLNGRLGGAAANTHVDIARSATALEFTATALPTPNWRVRFNMTYLFARFLDTVSYPQVYNDQFHTNAAGQVTYANGTVVYVNGAATSATTAAIVTPTTPGAVPLTIPLLENTTSPYWVSPDPSSGSISSTTMKTILGTTGAAGSVQATEIAANGAINTGAVGLPLSQNQYGFVSPYANSVVPIYVAGETATGYPGWQWNAQSDYTISNGPLSGLGAYLEAVVQYSIHGYYTDYPNTAGTFGSEASNVVNEHQVLVSLPPIANFNLGIHYKRKLRRVTWSTELEVYDIFNHDRFYIEPTASNGTYLTVTQRTPPRVWSWSTSLGF